MQPILVRVGKKVATENSSPYGGNPFNIYFKMYVIVEINGQQFKAEEGKKLFVHHIQNAENGATVDGAKVVCEVASHLVKGDKVLVFHKKRRKGYKKLNGHRQQFTELTIKQVIA